MQQRYNSIFNMAITCGGIIYDKYNEFRASESYHACANEKCGIRWKQHFLGVCDGDERNFEEAAHERRRRTSTMIDKVTSCSQTVCQNTSIIRLLYLGRSYFSTDCFRKCPLTTHGKRLCMNKRKTLSAFSIIFW